MSAFLEIVTIALAVLGCGFILIATLGLLRMPDLYMRIQAASKASTLGVALVCAACALRFESVHTSLYALLVLLFLGLTAPLAAHMLAKVAFDTVNREEEERGSRGES